MCTHRNPYYRCVSVLGEYELSPPEGWPQWHKIEHTGLLRASSGFNSLYSPTPSLCESTVIARSSFATVLRRD